MKPVETICEQWANETTNTLIEYTEENPTNVEMDVFNGVLYNCLVEVFNARAEETQKQTVKDYNNNVLGAEGQNIAKEAFNLAMAKLWDRS